MSEEYSKLVVFGIPVDKLSVKGKKWAAVCGGDTVYSDSVPAKYEMLKYYLNDRHTSRQSIVHNPLSTTYSLVDIFCQYQLSHITVIETAANVVVKVEATGLLCFATYINDVRSSYGRGTSWSMCNAPTLSADDLISLLTPKLEDNKLYNLAIETGNKLISETLL